MTPTEPTDFAAIAIAEELRQAQGIADIANESRPFGGGQAFRGEPSAWLNYAVGAGLHGPVSHDEVRALVEWYESAGIEPRIEVCPFAHAALLRSLADERFVLRRFESLFYRPLDPRRRAEPASAAPPGLRIEPVDPGDDAAVESFARTAISGFLPEGAEPPASLLESSMRVARHSRSTAFRAMLGDACVGAGAMEIVGDLAALFGVSVVPTHRRRGVQQALVAARLNAAADAGARVATIGSLPGVPTERNAQRAGFRLAYTRVTLVRPGEGLTPAFE